VGLAPGPPVAQMGNTMITNEFADGFGQPERPAIAESCNRLRSSVWMSVIVRSVGQRSILTTLRACVTFTYADWRTRSVTLTPLYCDRLTNRPSSCCRAQNRVLSVTSDALALFNSSGAFSLYASRSADEAVTEVATHCGEFGVIPGALRRSEEIRCVHATPIVS